jgi:AcrR family transcriptional regulator
MSRRRAYDNSRRAAQAGERVEQILDAVLDLLGSPQRDISSAAIARAAHVSVPTINKYFPNRRAIFEAAQARLNERFGRPSQPRSPEELRASIPHLYRFFAEHESMVRAAVTAPELRAFWEIANKRRNQGIRMALKDLTAHLPPDEATGVCAMVMRVIGAESWMAMKDDWSLNDEAAAAAAGRMLDRILASLRTGAGKGERR